MAGKTDGSSSENRIGNAALATAGVAGTHKLLDSGVTYGVRRGGLFQNYYANAAKEGINAALTGQDLMPRWRRSLGIISPNLTGLTDYEVARGLTGRILEKGGINPKSLAWEELHKHPAFEKIYNGLNAANAAEGLSPLTRNFVNALNPNLPKNQAIEFLRSRGGMGVDKQHNPLLLGTAMSALTGSTHGVAGMLGSTISNSPDLALGGMSSDGELLKKIEDFKLGLIGSGVLHKSEGTLKNHLVSGGLNLLNPASGETYDLGRDLGKLIPQGSIGVVKEVINSKMINPAKSAPLEALKRIGGLFKRGAEEINSNVVVTHNVHGDEPAGAEAAERLKSVEKVDAGNHTGKRRFHGKDLNRHFGTEESTEQNNKVLNEVLSKHPKLLVDLHEDNDARGVYAYTTPEMKGRVKEILAKMRNKLPTSQEAEGDKTDGGVITHGKYPGKGALVTAAREQGVPYVLLETPGKETPLNARVNYQQEFVNAITGKKASDEQSDIQSVHYARIKHDALRTLLYAELLKDRTNGRWKNKPELASKYVENRKETERVYREKLKAIGVNVPEDQSFLYSTIPGREKFNPGKGYYPHNFNINDEDLKRTLFDVVGLPDKLLHPDGPQLGQAGYDDAIARWDKHKKILGKSKYMGMTINPRIEVISPHGNTGYANLMKQGEATFSPDYTPEQLKEMGVYGEVYGSKTAPRLASLPEWPQHWYNEADPHGWLQWYNRYSKGRRIEDDDRQIKRWAAFKSRHGGKAFQTNPTPRRAFALRNWAVDPVQLLQDKNKKKDLIEAMEQYRAKKYKTAAATFYLDLFKQAGFMEKAALRFGGAAPFYKSIIKQLGLRRSGGPIALGAGIGSLTGAGAAYNYRKNLERDRDNANTKVEKKVFEESLKHSLNPIYGGLIGAVLGGAGGGMISKDLLNIDLASKHFARRGAKFSRKMDRDNKAWNAAWTKRREESARAAQDWHEKFKKTWGQADAEAEDFFARRANDYYTKSNYDYSKNQRKRNEQKYNYSGRSYGYPPFKDSKVEKAKSFLGIGEAKTKAEVKTVYKNLAKANHPDLGGDEHKMKKINDHYDAIKNSDWFEKLAFEIMLNRYNKKSASEKPGLWANIRAKRARGGKPAKPGDEGYPDKKQWKRLTTK